MTHYDIALVGSGSVNSFPGPDLAGRSIVQIDRGVGPPDRVFGGTCLNLGCIPPTKMFVHTADLARTPAESSRFGGVDEKLETVRWPDIRDRIFGRIDPISQGGGEEYRRDHEDNANLTLLRGTARFTAARTLSVELTDGSVEEVTADVIVLGAGSRPTIPPIDGLADAAPHTSDTIMRVEQLPSSLIILGSGGVVAVEMAHVLSSLGVEVTLVAAPRGCCVAPIATSPHGSRRSSASASASRRSSRRPRCAARQWASSSMATAARLPGEGRTSC